MPIFNLYENKQNAGEALESSRAAESISGSQMRGSQHPSRVPIGIAFILVLGPCFLHYYLGEIIIFYTVEEQNYVHRMTIFSSVRPKGYWGRVYMRRDKVVRPNKSLETETASEEGYGQKGGSGDHCLT